MQTLGGPALGYRHRARLAVRGRPGAPKIGVFQLGSHRIVDIPSCGVHHPSINRVARALKEVLREHRVPPYWESAGPGRGGRVRYLQVAVGRADGRVQVVLVDNGETAAGVEPVLDGLVQRLGQTLYSLHWNGQTAVGNAILGARWATWHGPEALREVLGGAQVFFPPGAFAQANMPLFAQVVEHIHARIPVGARVAEFYAGTGALGLGLVQRGQVVVCNELGAGSLQGLHLGRAALPEEAQARLRVAEGAAEEYVGEIPGADVVVVDPPRKGLDEPVLRALCEQPRPLLVYLSCGLHTFLRDAQALLRSGYHVQDVWAIDLFPNTGHVETLAFFEHS